MVDKIKDILMKQIILRHLMINYYHLTLLKGITKIMTSLDFKPLELNQMMILKKLNLKIHSVIVQHFK